MTEREWNYVSGAAVVIMAGVTLAHFLVPIPSLGKVVQAHKNEETKLNASISKLRDDVTTMKVENSKRVWTQPADQVSAAAMSLVTKAAQSRNLKVIAFRPQRTQDDSGVTRLPYLVSLEGSFPNVLQFVKSIENPATKLAVQSVQLASADGASDKVSATVGVVAYRELEEKKK